MNQNSTSRILKFCAFLCVTAVLVLSAKFFIFTFLPLDPGSTEAMVFEVHKGENPNEITKRLVTANIITEGRLFLRLGRLTRKWKNIKIGEYKVSPAMSPLQVLATITSGISLAHPITIREGENSYEIGSALENQGLTTKDEFIRLCSDSKFIRTFSQFGMSYPHHLEGYLYPDTYFFNRSQDTADMIRQMVHHFFDHWGLQEEQAAAQLNLTRHQVTTLASIVEKETGVARERPIISGVFHNRLKIGMKLQSDPTTIYGVWKTYDGNLHRKDLVAKNPYNTYAVSGLPLGPISNPGHEAIQAALHPVTNPYLYFVSHNDGTHEFSESLQAHNLAVRKFQLDPKARIGKSWRQLPQAERHNASQ